MIATATLLTLVALVTSAAPAPAPGPVDPLGLFSHADVAAKAAPGGWVEYALVEEGKPRLEETIRFAVIADAGGSGAWLEVWMDKAGRTAMRYPAPASRAAPGTAFLKMQGAFFSLEVPAAPSESACRATGGCGGAPKGGGRPEVVSVKTPAGTFHCRHVARGTGESRIEIWQSDEVPVFGLVRARLMGGRGYELVAAGKGATSAFPRAFEAVPFPTAAAQAAVDRLTPQRAPAGDGGPADAGADGPAMDPDAGPR